MRAVVLEKYGEPEVLALQQVPEPEPGPNEVRAKVAVCGLNRADIMQRQGQYPPPAPTDYEIPGLEFAGTIDKVGGMVGNWQVGDRVFGLLPSGGYAEQVVTHERMLMAIPDNLSFEEAAAIPEVFLTAYDALLNKGDLQAGDIVLIHAGGSGVGTAATQLAKVMGASLIFTTSRSNEKLSKSKEMGASRATNSKREDFDQVIREATGGYGADVILDFVGADYLDKNIQAAALEGKIVQIATLSGAIAQIDLRQMMAKRLRLIGTTLRSRPIEQKMVLTQQFASQMLPLFAQGSLKPVIDRSFKLEEVAQAHQYMESNSNFGKILLKVS